MDIQKAENIFWVYYRDPETAKTLDEEKCGKWMYYFNDIDFADKITAQAVKDGIVAEAKHSSAMSVAARPDKTGVCCFYLNGDDMEGHRKIIRFILDNNLVRKTKSGRYYNISFKFDQQTLAGSYGNLFHGEIRLADFVDLKTGEFLH